MGSNSVGLSEASWRSSFSDSERAGVIEKLTRILLSISTCGSESSNSERIQQIALRFESQVYSSAKSKREYYEIISNKVNTIAEKKKTSNGIQTASTAVPNNSQTYAAASQSQPQSVNNGLFANPNMAYFCYSQSQGQTGTVGFASTAVPNFALNPKQINNLSQPNQQQTKSVFSSVQSANLFTNGSSVENNKSQNSSVPSNSTFASNGSCTQPSTVAKNNPFIPQISLGSHKPPPLIIPTSTSFASGFPSTNEYSFVSPDPSGQYHQTDRSNQHNQFERQNAPSFMDRMGSVTQSERQSQNTYHRTGQYHEIPTTPTEIPTEKTQQVAGNLPILNLTVEERENVRKTIDSLKIFIPKIDILLNVSNSIGISQDSLKKVFNLKNILVKQIDLLNNNVFLLSPLMAENLSDHLKKFISLLLAKINSHPAAQSIMEKLKKSTSNQNQDLNINGNSKPSNAFKNDLQNSFQKQNEIINGNSYQQINEVNTFTNSKNNSVSNIGNFSDQGKVSFPYVSPDIQKGTFSSKNDKNQAFISSDLSSTGKFTEHFSSNQPLEVSVPKHIPMFSSSVDKKKPSQNPIIKDSPFKQNPFSSSTAISSSTTSASTSASSSAPSSASSNSISSSSRSSAGIQKKQKKTNPKVHKLEPNLLHRIPTLNYIKSKSVKNTSIPVLYLKSQLDFIQECSQTLGNSVSLVHATDKFKKQLCRFIL